MAHRSGYGGSIAFASGSKNWAAQVVRWESFKSTRQIETPYAGKSTTPRINGRVDWSADIDFLFDSGFTEADLQTGDAVTIRLTVAADEYEQGAGVVESHRSISPIDGYHAGRVRVVGNDSTLTFVT